MIYAWAMKRLPEILICLFLLAGAGALYWSGGKESRKAVKVAKTEIKAVAKSNKISRATQAKVEQEGADTRRQADADEGKLDADIRANPVADDPVDDDGMRVAQEAYERAVHAACRVQRASGCPDAPSTANVDE